MKVDVVGGPDCGRVYDVDPRQSTVLLAKEPPLVFYQDAQNYLNREFEVISAPIRRRPDGTYGLDCIHVSRHP